MGKQKHLTHHKQQLCSGEMQWANIPTRYGIVRGFQCNACGKTLHHVAEKQETTA